MDSGWACTLVSGLTAHQKKKKVTDHRGRRPFDHFRSSAIYSFSCQNLIACRTMLLASNKHSATILISQTFHFVNKITICQHYMKEDGGFSHLCFAHPIDVSTQASNNMSHFLRSQCVVVTLYWDR